MEVGGDRRYEKNTTCVGEEKLCMVGLKLLVLASPIGVGGSEALGRDKASVRGGR